MDEVLKMYVIVRRDLIKTLNWPLGRCVEMCLYYIICSLITQGCHASTAVLYSFRDDPNMQEYLKDIHHMHKITLEVCIISFLALFYSVVDKERSLTSQTARSPHRKTTKILYVDRTARKHSNSHRYNTLSQIRDWRRPQEMSALQVA